MAVIIGLSSDVGSADHTGHWLLPLFRMLAPWATPLLRWTGFVGGAGFLILNAIVGIPSGALWLTAPLAALLLLARRIYARSRYASPPHASSVDTGPKPARSDPRP